MLVADSWSHLELSKRAAPYPKFPNYYSVRLLFSSFSKRVWNHNHNHGRMRGSKEFAMDKQFFSSSLKSHRAFSSCRACCFWTWNLGNQARGLCLCMEPSLTSLVANHGKARELDSGGAGADSQR